MPDIANFLWPIVKLLAVAFFFYQFLRRSTLINGVGLLTITSAVLLDAASSIVGSEALQESLGFIFPLLQGGLFAGAAIWLWGKLRPSILAESRQGAGAANTSRQNSQPPQTISVASTPQHAAAARLRAGKSQRLQTAYDRQQMYEQIRTRLGREDVLDLIFDLGLNENDLIGLGRDMNDVIFRLMDVAEKEEMSGELALSVERILVPPNPDILPRAQSLSADSPPTILRHYLLANYSLAELETLAERLDIDWEQLGMGGKKEKVRGLLLYLYRRGQIEMLISEMVPDGTEEEE